MLNEHPVNISINQPQVPDNVTIIYGFCDELSISYDVFITHECKRHLLVHKSKQFVYPINENFTRLLCYHKINKLE